MANRKKQKQKQKKRKQVQPPPSGQVKDVASSSDIQSTVEKYKELYAYATDILLKEHERFNRADEKASNYSTTFVFLIGIIAYFDKWILDKLEWAEFPVSLPQDLSLLMASIVGLFALFVSAAGLFLASHVIKLRPIVSRPLNQQILDFFENHSQITIYYGLSREISAAYEKNRNATDQKYTLLKWSYHLMKLAVVLLAELLVMYCLYSWC